MTARDRIVIVVVLALAAVAGSFLMIIKPKRDLAASLGTQVSAEQSQLDSARAQLAQSQAARRAFASEYTQMVQLGEAVPPDDNVPSLMYQLQTAARAARVDFRSLQVAPGSVAATPAPSTSGSASKPATGSTAGASGASQSSTQLPPGVAVGPAGFPAEQFTFTFQGNFFHLSDYFNRLHRFVTIANNRIWIGGRLLTLNAISLTASPKGFPQINASVSATTYLLPASQGLVAGASPTGPASVGTPPAPGSGSGSSTPSTPTAAAAITPPSLQ